MTNRTEFETIFGKIPSEADSYKVVADGYSANGKKLVKSDRALAYEHAFMQQCSQYANRLLLGRFRLIVTIYDDTEKAVPPTLFVLSLVACNQLRPWQTKTNVRK